MRTYLFTTGLFSAISGASTLLRSLREEQFTWRTALGWLSWGISVALVVGAIVDVRRARHGVLAPEDSPISGHEAAIMRRHLRG
ncbi:hypothetical protein [Microbacterium thalassium]|uniref:NADH:ubiquinone oxidoreductase n=1 Tax=Microbacterium thalassium TaxID=362649 RepID=A0A7X0FR83_9MICO|nr:hypothetical protein [Microbacterium thalassium]MBB6392202.1 hypothetical protein [Microbacterium thalassium]GLK23413.1 hypothetical protein GCM10017607_07310 [Microbacterium thalassium]